MNENRRTAVNIHGNIVGYDRLLCELEVLELSRLENRAGLYIAVRQHLCNHFTIYTRENEIGSQM